MITDIREFCETFGACNQGRDWALAHCADMADAWRTLQPSWLVWVATREDVLSESQVRSFALWSVRQVWHLLTDQRSRRAVEVAERFERGEATQVELADATDAAYAAADAAYAAGRAGRAATDAAYAAADAAYAAGRAADAAGRAAYAAAAAGRAAADAAYAAGRAIIASAAQAAWLRESFPNPFVPSHDAEIETDDPQTGVTRLR